MSGAVTGEVHFVDCGFNTLLMPSLDALKEADQAQKFAARAARHSDAAE